MTEELMLTTEQTLVLIAIVAVLVILLATKPIKFEIDVPEAEEKQPERNLRYLQINRYYGG
ncbi:TPA: hypothetical protein ACGO8F_001393 [Streptococcus suis]